MKRDKDQILVEWLVLGAQLGDTYALSQLMRLIYPKLLRFSYRQLQDNEAVKDVVQNTLEVVVRDLSRLKTRRRFQSGCIKSCIERELTISATSNCIETFIRSSTGKLATNRQTNRETRTLSSLTA